MSDTASVKWGWVKTWGPIAFGLGGVLVSVVLYAQNISSRVDRQQDQIERMVQDDASIRESVEALRRDIQDMRQRNEDAHNAIILKLYEKK